MYDDGTKVSVNTVLGSYLFNVIGSASTDGFGYFGGGTGSTKGGIYVGNAATKYGGLWFDNSNNNIYLYQQFTSGNLQLGTNNTTIFTVGGTYTLDINGTGRFANTLNTGNTITSGADIVANGGSSTAVYVYNSGSIRGKLSMTGNEGDLTIYGSSATAKVYFSAYYDSYINSGAKLGIGTSSPNDKLSISGNVNIGNNYTASYPLDVNSTSDTFIRIRKQALGGNTGIYFETANDFSGTSQAYIKANGAGSNGTSYLTFGTAGANGDTTATERMRISATGNVGIGNSAPDGRLVIGATGTTTSAYIDYGGSTYGWYLQSYGGGVYNRISFIGNDFIWWTSGPTQKMTLTAGGTFCLNRTSSPNNGYPLLIKGGTGDYLMKFYSPNETYGGDMYCDNSNGQYHIRNGSADVWLTTSAGGWSNNSDISLKENLIKIDSAINKVNGLNGYYYNMIDNKEISQVGLIAQDVEKILPQAVSKHFSKTYEKEVMGIDYNKIVPLLVNAIQELSAEIEELKNK